MSSVNYDEACEAVRQAALAKRPFTVTALAVHGVMTGALDPEHRRRLNALDLIVPDGHPVRWGLNVLYPDRLRDRVYGPQLTLRICAMAEAQGLSVAFYGNRIDVLKELQDQLLLRFPLLRIVALMPSRFRRVALEEQKALAQQIVASGADILFVGLGCPRQEVWLFENGKRLNMPSIAVGAAFDFHARRIPQAPLWMQDHGLEWLFRLQQEPRRLWRRYIILNPLYVMMLTAQRLHLRRFDTDHTNGPVAYEGHA
jgi:N-acetylglucosaminyldiphosphoundecaprenol N-acetyl-beta-D-mannosaminyltransferase